MIKLSKQVLEMLESTWLRNQVENHLILGPLSKGGIALWGVVLGVAIVIELLLKGLPNLSGANFSQLFNIFYTAIIIYILYKMPSYHRAATLWLVTKFTLFIITLAMLIAGGLVGFFSGKPDAIHITILALIWIPGIEFFEKFSQKQKLITVIKILVSIPIVFLWYKTGTWH